MFSYTGMMYKSLTYNRSKKGHFFNFKIVKGQDIQIAPIKESNQHCNMPEQRGREISGSDQQEYEKTTRKQKREGGRWLVMVQWKGIAGIYYCKRATSI